MAEEILLVDFGVLLVLHLLDIGPCSESLVAAGDDNAANRFVERDRVEGRIELVEELRVER